ncbi:hypothetical protein JTB14_017199 [Gonioctena quinquepunctata]|nr:hypothetical protein JTB14_017199 [Gonioctena quinquepunctata]
MTFSRTKMQIQAENLTPKIHDENKTCEKKKTWITSGIVISINEGNKLHEERHKDWKNVELQTICRTYRNNLNLHTKKTKETFFKDKIEKNRNNSKKRWGALRESTDQNNKETGIREVCLENNGISFDPLEKANSLINITI